MGKYIKYKIQTSSGFATATSPPIHDWIPHNKGL